MAPAQNFPSSEERPTISYKEYQQNEYPTQWLTDNYGTETKEQNPSEVDANSQGLHRQAAEVQQTRHFQVGDRVVVKKIPVTKMKELQKNHGEWNPRMEESMGKEGVIMQFLPEGDLLIKMSGMVQWVLNRECVELLDEDLVKGDKARLKNLTAEEMEIIQRRTAAWVPILAEMKGRVCDVIAIIRQHHTVIIKLSNGYVFDVNIGLLEKVDKHEKEQAERGFLKGDIVQIQQQRKEKFTEHYAKHGLKLDSKVLEERTHEGKVIYVTLGRIIHVRMTSGNIVTCCPSILELKKQTTLSMEKTANASLSKAMADCVLPPNLPQDIREEAEKIHSESNEAMFNDFLDKQEVEETSGKTQSEQFTPGDLVLVKKMSFIDLVLNQHKHGGFNPNMLMTAGRQGVVIKKNQETGDLHVLLDGYNTLFVFNHDCIELVEKAEPHHFQDGQISRFKNLQTDEMKKLQENYGEWVPVMGDMKGRECTIRVRLPLHVETTDGYIWRVNPKLIESTVLQQCKDKQEKCFQIGDFVRVKDMKKNEIKKLCVHHGIQAEWGNENFRMTNKIGRVFEVKFGRIIHIQFITGQTTEGTAAKHKLLVSCRPVLDLVEKDKIPALEKEFNMSIEEQNNLTYCSQRVSLEVSAAGSRYRVDACPTPKDFLIAIATGNIQATNFILRQHRQWVDVVSDNGQETALMNACASGNIAIVKTLLDAGARVDLENIENNTPTIIAAWKGEKKILQYLLDKGSKLGRQNSQGLNALHAAIIGGSEECLSLLLQRCTLDDFKARSLHGMTPRLLAIKLNNERILKRILASDLFNTADKDENGGALPLHEAALWNNTFVVKVCLERNAKGLNEKKDDFWTPLHLAAFNSYIDVLKLLIEKGCSMNEINEDDETALFLAVKNCNQEVVELLLEANADLNIQNEDGETCLHHIFKRHEKAIDQKGILEPPLLPLEPLLTPSKPQWLNLARVLISKGAKTDIKDNDGKTPLDLIKDETFKAEILGCSMNEETSLFLAVKKCDQQAVELLLEGNADPNIPTEDGETCLHYIFKRQEESIDHLQSLESPIVISTPTKSQWLNLARVLISHGAKANVKDNNGKTPLDLIKDETFKAEILVLTDTLDTVDNNLKEFEQSTKDLLPEERLHRVYQSNNFAVRYFGVDGGILEVDCANVRMYVPPGAIKGQEQLIYIYLDPVNTIEGKVSPVVEVGPPGTTFNKKITLSYPHCAAKESEWKFSTMISQQTDSKYKEWKDVVKDEDVESFVKKGRVVIKTPHFTRFTTRGEPKTKDSPVEKNMRIGAFGKDHKKDQTTYQFRVRTWDDTMCATQVVRDKEKYLDSKPIDDDRPLLVCRNNGDVSVKVNNVKKGWKRRQHGNGRLTVSDVWENNYPSYTVDLDQTKVNAQDHNVHCQVRANQLKSPKREYVELSISPAIMTEDGGKDECRHRDTGLSLKVTLLGSFPADLPGLSEQLYLNLCGLLNVKNDAGTDWRCIVDELEDEDEDEDDEFRGMQVVNNIETKYTTKSNDSPANFVLRRYLYGCRGEGSEDPLDDLKDLFERKKLAQCLRLVEECILKKTTRKMDRLSV